MAFKGIFAVLATAIALVAATGSVRAQTPALADVVAAMATDDWTRADAMARQIDAEAGRGDILAAYVAAARYEEAGRCVEAATLADAVIAAIPFFAPAYMIAYRCYSQLGRSDVAADRLRALSGVIPPGPERDVVDQLLQNEEARFQPTVSGYFNVVPSSNANRQTSQNELIPGLPWIIPEEARGQAGVIFQAGAAVAQRLWGTDDLYLSGVLRTDVRYSTVDKEFDPYFTAELPLTFRRDAGTTYATSPYVRFGLSDNVHTLTEIGLRNRASLSLSEQQRLALELTFAALERPEDPRRNGYSIDGSVALTTVLTETVMLTTALDAEFDHTDDATLHTLEVSARGRLDTLLWDGLLVGLEGTIGRRFHNRPPPLSQGADQTDTFLTGRIDLSHREFAIGPVMPSVYYQYTRSWSDNIYYDYNSHDIGLTFRTRF
ncbi:surface lipoprotein assembly modifier [Pelagibacterium xiamenense]|uniref:surface lipoprotein assembly modifier n=1 Tax=Pelagibacterium xiamenense TaxID=2901140 RepID=UPI001E3E1F03|nr:surface lipoprotein assembly modifier [Pelagibacterium xiamenense]MCD7059780.1 surface lipoprotein assembly modifier [Pelagibacterium xiamenense]